MQEDRSVFFAIYDALITKTDFRTSILSLLLILFHFLRLLLLLLFLLPVYPRMFVNSV